MSPPATVAPSKSNVLGGPSTAAVSNSSDLMMMGFPPLVHSPYPGLCSCHSKLKNMGYVCPRCKSRICDVPTECRVCGLTNVSSPHLARSYKHLFPVRLASEIREFKLITIRNRLRIMRRSMSEDFPSFCKRINLTHPQFRPTDTPSACYACTFPFKTTHATSVTYQIANELSATGRYSCKNCSNHFCFECDKLVHEALGFCPGCI